MTADQRKELDALAHSLAYEFATGCIESACVIPEKGWLVLGDDEMESTYEDDMRYLSLRGLLERHHANAQWFRFLDESEANA